MITELQANILFLIVREPGCSKRRVGYALGTLRGELYGMRETKRQINSLTDSGLVKEGLYVTADGYEKLLEFEIENPEIAAKWIK